MSGKTRQKHSDQCRARMAEAMVGTKRVEDAKERKRKYIEEALKAEELKSKLQTTLDDGRAQRASAPKITLDDGRAQRAPALNTTLDGGRAQRAPVISGGDKRKILEEIEAAAMQTDDIEELGKLFTEYMEDEFRATGRRRTAEGGAGAPAGKGLATKTNRAEHRRAPTCRWEAWS